MKRKLMIITTALCVLAMAMALTACGSANESKTQSSSSIESTESTAATPAPESDTCVVYFSATGNTRQIANKIAKSGDFDLYEIKAAEPYSDEDLDYSVEDCRANQEQNDDASRPEIDKNSGLDTITSYKRIFLGYPIWWGTNPRIINTLLDQYDLSGTEVYAFCTSGGTDIETSLEDIESASGIKIISGKRFETGASDEDVAAWLESLE